MDTALLYRAMYEDKNIRRQLGGVLAADIFCDQIKRPGFYIVNSDELRSPGKHWIAFYVNKDCTEYFDSFGNPPEFYQTYFRAFLNTQVQGYKYSMTRLQQSGTLTCGHFCLFYCFYRSRGKNMNEIVRMLFNMNNADIQNFVLRNFKSVL